MNIDLEKIFLDEEVQMKSQNTDLTALRSKLQPPQHYNVSAKVASGMEDENIGDESLSWRLDWC